MAELIPDFTDEGLHPFGSYEVTFEELRKSILVTGPESDSPWGEEWDTEWREHLTRQAKTMCSHLWEVGIEEIYLDGPFTEAKAHPNDIDGYSECDVRRVATGAIGLGSRQVGLALLVQFCGAGASRSNTGDDLHRRRPA